MLLSWLLLRTTMLNMPALGLILSGLMVHAAETRALATASHDRRALNRVQVGKAQRGRFNAVVEKKSISWTAATRANTSKPAGNVAAIVV